MQLGRRHDYLINHPDYMRSCPLRAAERDVPVSAARAKAHARERFTN